MLRLYNLLQIVTLVCFPVSLISDLAVMFEIRQQALAGLFFITPVGIYLLKVNDRNTKTKREI